MEKNLVIPETERVRFTCGLKTTNLCEAKYLCLSKDGKLAATNSAQGEWLMPAGFISTTKNNPWVLTPVEELGVAVTLWRKHLSNILLLLCWLGYEFSLEGKAAEGEIIAEKLVTLRDKAYITLGSKKTNDLCRRSTPVELRIQTEFPQVELKYCTGPNNFASITQQLTMPYLSGKKLEEKLWLRWAEHVLEVLAFGGAFFRLQKRDGEGFSFLMIEK